MDSAGRSGGPPRVVAGASTARGTGHGPEVGPIRLVCLWLAATLAAADGVGEVLASALRRAGFADAEVRALEPALRRGGGLVSDAVLRAALADPARAEQARDVLDAAVLAATDRGLIAPAAGARRALQDLRALGVAVCLACPCSERLGSALLAAAGWPELVDLTLSAQDGRRGPPFPDLVLTALLQLGLDDVRQVAVVGATPEELTAGRRAGAGLLAGLAGPGFDPAQLDGAPHTHLLRSIAELAELPELRGGTPPAPDPGRRVPARGSAQPVGPTAPAILDVAELTIYYGTHRAVNGLGLQVRQGEIFGLLGPNGAGKTSTLSAVEGLLKPRAGSITVDGVDALRRPIEAKVRMGVQLQATSFQTSLTLKQIVQLYAGLYGVAMGDREVAAVLAEIGLDAEIGREFKQLSGGQKQRLSLQIAVIHSPSLLLLDEPTAGLDPQARRQLWGRIEHLRRTGGSILLTTHSMEEAQAVCDRVAIMDHGRVLTTGSPAELIDAHRRDPRVTAVAHGEVTLDDVFVGLTGTHVRD